MSPHAASPISRTRVSRAFLPVLGAALLLALAGCGSSSTSSGSSSSSASTPPGRYAATSASTKAPAPATPAPAASGTTGAASSSLSVAADAQGALKYDKTALTAKAGAVSIDFTNMSPIEHNLTVESSSGSTVGATPTFQGAAKTVSVNLKPGTYKFYCSVPGHRQAGMEGTITVH